ncbi:MAG: 4Fe-4S dicluster domain-containing protein [Pseudomonadota bacterium]
MKEVNLIPVYFYGKRYDVPDSFTVIQAYEFTGHQYTRGCGCRGGACGACGALFITPENRSIKVGLACQTQVVPDMSVIQIPYFPTEKPVYALEKISPETISIAEIYPKILQCMGCNTCTKMCPQDIDVMECISAALGNDVEETAIQSSSCVMCGLCAARCPAEIAPYEVMLLSRRVHGRYILQASRNLRLRLKQLEENQFDAELDELVLMDTVGLKERYKKQQADKRLM